MDMLSPSEYLRVRPLCDSVRVARSFPFAVLDGNHAGTVYVDDAAHPSAALISMMAGFHACAGDPARVDFVREAAAQILRTATDEFVLFLPLSEPWRAALDAALGPRGGIWALRLEYSMDAAAVALHGDWRGRVPDGARVVPYDRGLIASAPGLADYWGGGEAGIDRFTAHGAGCAFLLGGAVASRAHAVFVGDGIAETALETGDAYRRRGYALTTALAYVGLCQERGLTPSWSCWAYDGASQALAAAVGFARAVEVPVLVVKRPPA